MAVESAINGPDPIDPRVKPAESNITRKNNGLIDEEPKLMYIYRQGLPGR
jgi:hypothetical protein